MASSRNFPLVIQESGMCGIILERIFACFCLLFHVSINMIVQWTFFILNVNLRLLWKTLLISQFYQMNGSGELAEIGIERLDLLIRAESRA